MGAMRTATLRLKPPDGGLHPADREVTAHTSLEPEAIDHITALDDGTGVVLCRIRGEAATVREVLAETPRLLEYNVTAADPTVYAPVGVRERFAQDADALAERVRANARAGGLRGDRLTSAVEDAVESLERDRTLLAPDRVDEWVKPGPVSFGSVTAEAVHTPGHQADHLAYFVDGDDRLLLSGDTVMEPFRAVVLHDGMDDGHREAFAAYFDGLDRLATRNADRVYPGHGAVHERFSELVERDRESLDRRLDTVASLVADGHETVPAVAGALAGDRPSRYLFTEASSRPRSRSRASALIASVNRYRDGRSPASASATAGTVS